MTSMTSKILLASALSVAFTSAAMAQTASEPGHPRINEVDQRLDNQQNRIENGEANGTLTSKQAAHDERHDQHIEKKLAHDEAKHDGHITRHEQAQMNKQLDHNSVKIRDQKEKGTEPMAQ